MTRSPAMAAIMEQIRSVARTPDTTVVIHGESGTGKELVANATHQLSQRAQKPLIAVSCGAIPEALFESELFGHERGAFSGATDDRKGRLELADGGTIFLDEIGELPLAGGNQTRAARLLGIQRLALARAAARLGITTGRVRPGRDSRDPNAGHDPARAIRDSSTPR